MNLFVNSLTTACKIWLQLVKNFFESTYMNFDHNLLSQVTVNAKKPDYIYVTSSPLTLYLSYVTPGVAL